MTMLEQSGIEALRERLAATEAEMEDWRAVAYQATAAAGLGTALARAYRAELTQVRVVIAGTGLPCERFAHLSRRGRVRYQSGEQFTVFGVWEDTWIAKRGTRWFRLPIRHTEALRETKQERRG